MHRRPTARWAETNGEVRHYSKIAQECLVALRTMRPYLTVTLRDETIVHGWLKGLSHEDNARQDALAPTAWRGSIILQDGELETEIDFLEVESVHSASVRHTAGGGVGRRGQPELGIAIRI